MEDRGKRPVIEEDEFEGSSFSNWEFTTGGACRFPIPTNYLHCNIASTSSAAETSAGEGEGEGEGKEKGCTSSTIQEKLPLPADETIFYEFTESDFNSIQAAALANELSTSCRLDFRSSIGSGTTVHGVSANSADEIGQRQILYSPGNAHGSGLYPNYYNFTTGENSSGQLSMNRGWNPCITNNTRFTGQDEDRRPQNYGSYPIQQNVASNMGTRIGIPLMSEANLDLNNLNEILLIGDHHEINKLISMLRGSYSWLMINEHTHSLFHNLLNVCNKKQLCVLAHHILSDGLFMEAAFTNAGSKSMIRFIKKIRKLSEAFTLTRLLSTKFWDLMTEEASKDIIPQCFLVLPEQPNQVLYEKALEFSRDLAVHQIGCPSLNECLSVASGTQGLNLLLHIAKLSPYLSQHLFGNYVVQTVLSLQNISATTMILQHLRGRFVELSQQKSGSHVVEKCLAYFPLGTVLVCDEITSDPHIILQIAQHQFGNYVIQRAVVEAKKLPGSYRRIYHTLLECLLNHKDELSRNQYGRGVSLFLKKNTKINQLAFTLN